MSYVVLQVRLLSLSLGFSVTSEPKLSGFKLCVCVFLFFLEPPFLHRYSIWTKLQQFCSGSKHTTCSFVHKGFRVAPV